MQSLEEAPPPLLLAPPLTPVQVEVTEVDGLKLHLSSNSPTGYTGVKAALSGRFQATYAKQ